MIALYYSGLRQKRTSSIEFKLRIIQQAVQLSVIIDNFLFLACPNSIQMLNFFFGNVWCHSRFLVHNARYRQRGLRNLLITNGIDFSEPSINAANKLVNLFCFSSHTTFFIFNSSSFNQKNRKKTPRSFKIKNITRFAQMRMSFNELTPILSIFFPYTLS